MRANRSCKLLRSMSASASFGMAYSFPVNGLVLSDASVGRFVARVDQLDPTADRFGGLLQLADGLVGGVGDVAQPPDDLVRVQVRNLGQLPAGSRVVEAIYRVENGLETDVGEERLQDTDVGLLLVGHHLVSAFRTSTNRRDVLIREIKGRGTA